MFWYGGSTLNILEPTYWIILIPVNLYFFVFFFSAVDFNFLLHFIVILFVAYLWDKSHLSLWCASKVLASLCVFGHCGNNNYWIKKNGVSWFHFSCLNQEFQELHLIILACQSLTSIQWLSCYNDYDLVIQCWPSKDDFLTNLVFCRFQLLSIPEIFRFLCWLCFLEPNQSYWHWGEETKQNGHQTSIFPQYVHHSTE